MADQTDCRLITVNPGDDDDIVIVVGVPENDDPDQDILVQAAKSDEACQARAAGVSRQGSGESQGGAEVRYRKSGDARKADGGGYDAVSRKARQASQAVEAKPAACEKPGSSSEAKDKDSYHPTTLEDIRGSKMSKTQIAVVVLSISAIIAFIVWYTMFA